MSRNRAAKTGREPFPEAPVTTDRETALPRQSELHEAISSTVESHRADGSPRPSTFDEVDGSADDDMTTPEDRIRQRAYEIYCSRPAGDGNELDDWLAAERELRLGHDAAKSHASRLLETLPDGDNRDAAR